MFKFCLKLNDKYGDKVCCLFVFIAYLGIFFSYDLSIALYKNLLLHQPFEMPIGSVRFKSDPETFFILKRYFFSCVVAPCVETFIFVVCLIRIFRLVTKDKNKLAAISALLFALAHFATGGILYVFMLGLLLALLFLVIEAASKKSAFWHVALTHSACNFFAISYYLCRIGHIKI
jgi:membrane protease YdiL (CAAX protease family)